MLGHNDVIANIPVTDLERSRAFYEKTLGLTFQSMIGDYCMVFRSGDTRVNVYKNIAPWQGGTVVASWLVEDVLETIVDELKGRGVIFRHFEKDSFEAEGDIYKTDHFKMSLFKDPDENLLCLFQPNL